MKRLLSLLFVTSLLVAVMASCMSPEEKALKESVDQYAATLPNQVVDGFVVDAIDYTPSDSTVTLTCTVENQLIAAGLKHAMGGVKTMFIPYLKSQKGENEMVNNIVAAKARLKCVFRSGDEQIGDFTVESSEL